MHVTVLHNWFIQVDKMIPKVGRKKTILETFSWVLFPAKQNACLINEHRKNTCLNTCSGKDKIILGLRTCISPGKVSKTMENSQRRLTWDGAHFSIMYTNINVFVAYSTVL